MSLATRLSFGFPLLPRDVQHYLFPFIRSDRKLLRICTLVCKHWDTHLSPGLFRTFVLAPPRVGKFDLLNEIRLLEDTISERVTHSYTGLVAYSALDFPMDRLLFLLSTLLPNIRSLRLSATNVTMSVAFVDRAEPPPKVSLRDLSIDAGDMLTEHYEYLLDFLRYFERVDNLSLTGSSPLRFEPGTQPQPESMPYVKSLSAESVNPSFLQYLVRQPRFADNLETLVLTTCFSTAEDALAIANTLRTVKNTLRCFVFKPSFSARFSTRFDGTVNGPFHRLGNELASCTSLREVRLQMTCPPVDNHRQLASTFDFHCLLMSKIAQARLAVAVDFGVWLDTPTDSGHFDAVMAKLKWDHLDRTAGGLRRLENGKAPLRLSFTRGRMALTADQREVVARIKDLDWRALLPILTNPEDLKVDIQSRATGV